MNQKSKKLRAGALYYAVFISFIIALILGSLLLYLYFHNKYLNAEILQNRLIDNVDSGISIALASPQDIPYNSAQTIDLFEEGSSTVTLTRKHWGALDIIRVSSQIKKFEKEKIALLGEYIFNTENQSLYLSDQKKYLSISGNTRIVGDSKLPRLGIKQAYIEGEGYTGEKLVYGRTGVSKKQLPSLNKRIITENQKYFSEFDNFSDSIVFSEQILSTDTIRNSFYQKTLVIYFQKAIEIDYQKLSGNVIVISDEMIHIGSNTDLKDVILYAPSIVIKSGFTGNGQFFAQQNIEVGSDCRLTYPSFIGLLGSESEGKKELHIGRGTEVNGGVLVLGRSDENTRLTLNNDSRIFGQVYCKGSMVHKGNITGSLYCRKFVLQTKSTLYENHLLNATIDFTSLSESYAGFDLLHGSDEKRVIKWLN